MSLGPLLHSFFFSFIPRSLFPSLSLSVSLLTASVASLSFLSFCIFCLKLQFSSGLHYLAGNKWGCEVPSCFDAHSKNNWGEPYLFRSPRSPFQTAKDSFSHLFLDPRAHGGSSLPLFFFLSRVSINQYFVVDFCNPTK